MQDAMLAYIEDEVKILEPKTLRLNCNFVYSINCSIVELYYNEWIISIT